MSGGHSFPACVLWWGSKRGQDCPLSQHSQLAHPRFLKSSPTVRRGDCQSPRRSTRGLTTPAPTAGHGGSFPTVPGPTNYNQKTGCPGVTAFRPAFCGGDRRGDKTAPFPNTPSSPIHVFSKVPPPLGGGTVSPPGAPDAGVNNPRSYCRTWRKLPHRPRPGELQPENGESGGHSFPACVLWWGSKRGQDCPLSQHSQRARPRFLKSSPTVRRGDCQSPRRSTRGLTTPAPTAGRGGRGGVIRAPWSL